MSIIGKLKSFKEYGPILGVAVVYAGVCYRLPAPNRHHNVLQEIVNLKGSRLIEPNEEGFYSACSTFLTRGFAMEVALACDQVNRRVGAQYYQGPELFSEDLW